MRPGPDGYYSRQLGWEISRSGKLQQHKFRLGTDRKEAERRERRLRTLWEQYEATRKESRPLWPEGLLAIAQSIAKGGREIAVARRPDELQMTYANRIRRLQVRYPVIAFVPEDQYAFDVGQEALQELDRLARRDLPQIVPKPLDEELIEAWNANPRLLEFCGLGGPGEKSSLMDTLCDDEGAATSPERERPSAGPTGAASGASGWLHGALHDYQRWVEREFHRPELGRITPWGRTQVRQIDRLIEHHRDRPLSNLNEEGIDELIGYWRRRPLRKDRDVPVTHKSASNYISQLNRFFRWLHRSPNYDWRKPAGFVDISTRVAELPGDRARDLEQVDTFSRDELILLMRYGQPLDRLVLLLGLNCGFGVAEIASLLVGEVHLRQAHEPRYQEILHYETTDNDSFIKRIRRKNGVYGEFILFPQTVLGLEWALERRRGQSGFGTNVPLLLNEQGQPFDRPTVSGNRNQQIPNYFARLIKRIQDDGHEIRRLSFGKLRKTAGNLVRLFSDGETMAVFHCRGEAVRTDDLADVYSNRPFGRVFRAIREVERYLAPVFEAAGPQPFDPQPQAYTSRSTIERITRLHAEGHSVGHIAHAIGISRSAVSRHIQRQMCESGVET